jgi:sugar/nucleoside kinase (ribokinase family)
VNHVGAGDCFAAHLTLALAYGFSLKEAAGLAHSAGRVYVQSFHNHPPFPTDIAADMSTVT